MFKIILCSCAMVLAALAPISCLAAAPVPFTATVRTTETLGFNPAACASAPFLQGTATGAGNASHLGNVTASSTDCVSPSDSGYTFTGGHLILTAANGDTLIADYSGSLTATAEYPVYSLSGSFRVSGGTGRFVGATGSGYLQGTENIVSGTGSYTATGQITY